MNDTGHPALILWPDGYVLRTPRLCIRPVDPTRADEVNAAIRESASELRPWLPWCQDPPGVEETRAFARTFAEAFRIRSSAALWVFDGDDVFSLASGLHPGHPGVPALAVGYWCRTACTRRGYVTEVARALAAVAFHHLGVERLVITCDARNERSAGVARRAGFEYEGRLRRDDRRVDGTLRDTDVFSLVVGDPGVPSMDGLRFGPP